MRFTLRWTGVACLAIVVAAVVSACAGHSGVMPASGPNALSPMASNAASQAAVSEAVLHPMAPINTYPGAVIGKPNAFTPPEGDMAAGGRGQRVDGIPCRPREFLKDYHIHIYVGVIVNGRHYAMPAAIGMKDPGPEVDGYIKKTGCFYYIHTHDSSGIVHVEDPRQLPPSSVVYTLGNFLKIWGIRYTATSFGAFKGPVHIYVGHVPALGDLNVRRYVEYKQDVGTIPIRSHEAVWIEVGSGYFKAKQLPSVHFYMEY